MKTSKRHLYGLILVLFCLGLGLFFYRYSVLGVPLTDKEQVMGWVVEAHVKFMAEPNVPLKASFTIPHYPPQVTILDEDFVSHHYGVATQVFGDNRRVTWSLRRGFGQQFLYYRAILQSAEAAKHAVLKVPPFEKNTVSETQKMVIEMLIKEARQSSADILTFAQSTIRLLNQDDGNTKLLIGSEKTDVRIVSAALLVLTQANIHAIPVQGIYLTQQNKAAFHVLLAVYDGAHWNYIDPKTGHAGIPKDFLVWQYGLDPMYDVVGGKHVQFDVTVSPAPLNALHLAHTQGMYAKKSQLLRFSLLQLPLNVQETYKILLTVPIGAFIILVLRNFIGLKTFGTFMPVLIALAFRETHVIWGILMFILIVSFGLLARFYLDQLRLLLVPRLAAILTVVIMLMIFISVLSQHLGFQAGLSVALFPMIILTMTIERMCILWDERGPSDAIKSGVGSLFAAVITFFVMNDAKIQYLIFAFPELLLIVLAVILWFGQYRGYRLVELMRFKVLAEKK